MRFSEKLRNMRAAHGMTQSELASLLGTTARTVQNYELGCCYPRKRETIKKIAEIFGVEVQELVSSEDEYIFDAQTRAGSGAAHDLDALISDIGGLFAGGELSEEDKDRVMRAVTELYWKAKENNKKYARKD